MTIDGVPQEQTSWYEATLSLKERRSRGHFSTPPRLVEHILDACGYTADKHLADRRVLDPACGSGNFLAGAAHRLITFATRTNHSQTECAALIQRNIWGIDPDPISCFLAEMQLSAITGTTTSMHIHQADGLTLPWQAEPCIDLFLANPPYLAAKNIDLSGYRSAQQRGQADSYLLFLSLGLQIVRPHGWLALVLPDPVLARTNATEERTRLLKEFSIHHLWHLANAFPAQVGAVVIIAQKCPPKSTHQVTWIREKWEQNTVPPPGLSTTLHFMAMGADVSCPPPMYRPLHGYLSGASPQTIPQTILLRQPHAELRYLLNSEQGSTIERLRIHLDETPEASRRFAPLSEFLYIRRGEELGRKNSYLKNLPLQDNGCQSHETCYPVLRGGREVRPYRTVFGGYWIEREAITKPLERYLLPKLLVVKSTNRLQAALDLQGHVALQTLYLLYPREQEASVDDLYFFLALLNSRLLQHYVYVLHTAYKWVQPQIEQHVLARLPVPIVATEEKQQIIDKAKLLMRACSDIGPVVEWNEAISSMYEEQERAICALYDAALL